MAIGGSPTATASSGPPASRATNHSHGRAIERDERSTRARASAGDGFHSAEANLREGNRV